MQKSPSIFKRIIATLSFFTRLPFWRLCQVPAECYQKVVPLWPLAGWVTGGVMAAVFALSVHLLPLSVAVVLALVSRVLLTGALHEDGFADFCDGFGGGTTRQRRLEIMKDSHIGTYGVLALVLYYLLVVDVLVAIITGVSHTVDMPLWQTGATLLVVIDPLAKMLSSATVWWLPYARTAQTAKNRMVYAQVTLTEKLLTLVLGTLPFILLCPMPIASHLIIAFWAAAIVFCALVWYMHSRIGGYTGDCCGAMFIITELTMYLTLLVASNL